MDSRPAGDHRVGALVTFEAGGAGDLAEVAGVAADHLHARELPHQVLVQFLVELEHEQVRRRDAVFDQRPREHAGAAAELDHAMARSRQLGHHLPGQLAAGRRYRRNPEWILQPLAEEGPARGLGSGRCMLGCHQASIMPAMEFRPG